MAELAGAEIVVGDCSQPETVDFAGAEKVYLVPPLAPGWNAMQRALIEAARRAGVQHIARISAIGVGRDEPSMSLSYHWQGEQEMEASGMAWTHIRGNSFSQNTLLRGRDDQGREPLLRLRRRLDLRQGRHARHRRDRREGADRGRPPGTDVRADRARAAHVRAARREALGGARAGTIEYVDLSLAERAAQLKAAGLPDWLAKEFPTSTGKASTAQAAARTRRTRRAAARPAAPQLGRLRPRLRRGLPSA